MPPLHKSKSLIIQTATPYQTNPGPVTPPVPYDYKGLTDKDEVSSCPPSHKKEKFNKTMPYTSSESDEYAEKGEDYHGIAGRTSYQISVTSFAQLPLPEQLPEPKYLQTLSSPSTQGILYHYDRDITASEIDQPRPETPSHASQYVSEDSVGVWWLSSHHTEIQQHNELIKRRRKMLDTIPEREYGDFVIPSPCGWRSALDAHMRTMAQQDYESALLMLILGQGRELAMIGTEMVCFGDLNDTSTWVISKQRSEKGSFYISVWVNHVLKKRVKVWVLKEYFYPVPTTSAWERVRYVTKKLLKASLHPNKSTSQLPNF
ncbi:hypothetical protein C8R43DRAFT_941732 [Mycena crocata]|nr:hypothetical protein C8R43DRAFT_941732 [Mycena crocata]